MGHLYHLRLSYIPDCTCGTVIQTPDHSCSSGPSARNPTVALDTLEDKLWGAKHDLQVCHVYLDSKCRCLGLNHTHLLSWPFPGDILMAVSLPCCRRIIKFVKQSHILTPLSLLVAINTQILIVHWFLDLLATLTRLNWSWHILIVWQSGTSCFHHYPLLCPSLTFFMRYHGRIQTR